MFGVDIELIVREVIKFSGNMINNLQPTVISIFASLVIIDIVLSFLFDESESLNILMKFAKKMLFYCFFFYIIIEYKDLMYHTLFEGAVQLGNLANKGSTSSMLDFELLGKFGVDIGDLAGSFLVGLGFVAGDVVGVESVATIGLGAVAAYIMFFIFLYIFILTTVLKFFFMAGFAYILMPFAGFEKTKDITLKGLNGLFSQSIEIYVLIVLLNFMDYLRKFSFWQVTGGIKDTLWTRWALLIFMFSLVSKTGTIASSLMAGAIASFGTGATGMSNSASTISSAPGKVVSNDISNASKANSENRMGEHRSAIYKMAAKFSGKNNGSNNSNNKDT